MKNESFNVNKEDLKLLLEQDVTRREILVARRKNKKNLDEEILPESLPSFRLQNGSKKDSRLIKEGKNKTSIVDFENEESGVFKPASGEDTSLKKNTEPNTFYKRERASYLVALYLGFDFIPPTVIREIDGEVGSVQQFIKNREKYRDILQNVNDARTEDKFFRSQMKSLWLFDLLTHNSDRHKGNLICSDSDVGLLLHAIDNGCSFSPEEYRWDADEYFDQKFPEEIISKIRNFLDDEESKEMLRQQLFELLPKKEVFAFFKRLEIIGNILIENKKITESKRAEVTNF